MEYSILHGRRGTCDSKRQLSHRNEMRGLILIVLILLKYSRVNPEQTTIGPTLIDQLDRAHRNALCCKKKMRCCKKLPPPNIELRAVIVRCPRMSHGSCRYMNRYMKKTLSEENEYDIKKFEGFDEDEPLVQSVVTKCHKKIVLTMKIKNKGPTNTKSQFIVIDHVYDPLSGRAVQLLNPYIIKLKQEHVSQTYGLKFLDFVNSNAREQVYNKHDGNYTGCRTNGKRPTCGVVKYHGKVIPYSQGFCCSCDAQKNADRQPQSAVEPQPYIEQSDPAYLFDAVPCPRTYMHEKTNKSMYFIKNKTEDTSSIWITETTTCPTHYGGGGGHERDVSREETMKHPSVDNNYKMQNMNDDYEDASANREDVRKPIGRGRAKKQKALGEENYFFLNEKYGHMPRFEDLVKRRPHHLTKRQVQSSGVQIRGGQNCADRYTPPHLNQESYHESTHCLRFSPVWYAVYKLNKPVIEQEIIIQIFEKYETESGAVKWKDLTNGKRVKLGTFFSSYQDDTPTISLTYVSKADEGEFCLDINQYRLLIPEGFKDLDVENYPEAKGGPSEFLILKAGQIYMSGDQCDSAGVGFEAFYKQPNRCSMPRGTCLRRQPKHLWLHDKRMERQRKRGCYFLKYYGQLSKDPIRENRNTSEKYLALNYYGLQVSVIEMEINADFNAVLRPQSSAVITEVYIDSTNLKTSFLTVKITNSGLLASIFMIRISDCPLDVLGKLKEITSKPVIIPPQNQHVFQMNISNDFSADIFFCSVEALDARKEIVALRRIRIQLLDRCICTWHCLCACIGSSHGLKCIPMQTEHYHAAGFIGGLPVVTYAKHIAFVDDVITLLFYMLLFMLFTLLVLGLTKGLIGLCCAPVGMWGLNILLDLPKPMKKYYEKDLNDQEVEYDDEGWPVHPGTKEKTRNIPKAAEFCTNVLFFFTYPCIVLLLLSRRLCCPLCDLDRFKKFRRTCKKPSCTDRTCKHEQCQATAENKRRSKSPEEKKENRPKRTTRVKVSIKEGRKNKKNASDEEGVKRDAVHVGQCVVSGGPFRDGERKSRRVDEEDQGVSCRVEEDQGISHREDRGRTRRVEEDQAMNHREDRGRTRRVDEDQTISSREDRRRTRRVEEDQAISRREDQARTRRVEEDQGESSGKYLKDLFERIIAGRRPNVEKTEKLKAEDKEQRKYVKLGFLSREHSAATVKSVKGKSNLWEDDDSAKMKRRKRRPRSM